MNPTPLRKTSGPADWRDLLGDPDRHWRAGYSAMACAQSWEAGFPSEVARLLGADAELQVAIVEHRVPLPGGGAPSQCDVFALVRADGRDLAVAVEAKVEEPFGPTLAEWQASPSKGKTARLEAICGWLGIGIPGGVIRYQLLHRTAAAVAEARRWHRPVAAMIVQSFSRDGAWFDDYAAFLDLFGSRAGWDEAADSVLPDGTILRLGWATGDPRFLSEI